MISSWQENGRISSAMSVRKSVHLSADCWARSSKTPAESDKKFVKGVQQYIYYMQMHVTLLIQI